jgi:hypothetical protein
MASTHHVVRIIENTCTSSTQAAFLLHSVRGARTLIIMRQASWRLCWPLPSPLSRGCTPIPSRSCRCFATSDQRPAFAACPRRGRPGHFCDKTGAGPVPIPVPSRPCQGKRRIASTPLADDFKCHLLVACMAALVKLRDILAARLSQTACLQVVYSEIGAVQGAPYTRVAAGCLLFALHYWDVLP